MKGAGPSSEKLCNDCGTTLSTSNSRTSGRIATRHYSSAIRHSLSATMSSPVTATKQDVYRQCPTHESFVAARPKPLVGAWFQVSNDFRTYKSRQNKLGADITNEEAYAHTLRNTLGPQPDDEIPVEPPKSSCSGCNEYQKRVSALEKENRELHRRLGGVKYADINDLDTDRDHDDDEVFDFSQGQDSGSEFEAEEQKEEDEDEDDQDYEVSDDQEQDGEDDEDEEVSDGELEYLHRENPGYKRKLDECKSSDGGELEDQEEEELDPSVIYQ